MVARSFEKLCRGRVREHQQCDAGGDEAVQDTAEATAGGASQDGAETEKDTHGNTRSEAMARNCMAR